MIILKESILFFKRYFRFIEYSSRAFQIRFRPLTFPHAGFPLRYVALFLLVWGIISFVFREYEYSINFICASLLWYVTMWICFMFDTYHRSDVQRMIVISIGWFVIGFGMFLIGFANGYVEIPQVSQFTYEVIVRALKYTLVSIPVWIYFSFKGVESLRHHEQELKFVRKG